MVSVPKTGNLSSWTQTWHYIFSSPEAPVCQLWLLTSFFNFPPSLYFHWVCDRWPHIDQSNNCPNRASIMGLGFNNTARIMKKRSFGGIPVSRQGICRSGECFKESLTHKKWMMPALWPLRSPLLDKTARAHSRRKSLWIYFWTWGVHKRFPFCQRPAADSSPLERALWGDCRFKAVARGCWISEDTDA